MDMSLLVPDVAILALRLSGLSRRAENERAVGEAEAEERNPGEDQEKRVQRVDVGGEEIQ